MFLMFVGLFVCLPAGLYIDYQPNFHEIWWNTAPPDRGKPITFWIKSGSE